jgi:23S rRNA pseudouridine1911/1915/1917 synthase
MKEIIINKNNVGKRIDKFLASYFASAEAIKDKQKLFSSGITRKEITRNIRAGKVLVNGKEIKPGYVLRSNDIIIYKQLTTDHKLLKNPNLKIQIIYQDENIIVVDKPAGIAVHPSKSSENNTLVNWLIAKFPEVKEVIDSPSHMRDIYQVYTTDPKLRPGIVHRLDKNTSGVMVIARNLKSFEELKKLFKEHKVEKKYLALVYGILENKKSVIEKPIARAGNYKKQTIAGRKTKTKIREAVTEYEVLKEFNNYSLLKVIPKTGRMHQIRVHLFSIGHPVAGDKLYKLKKNSRLSIEIPRQMLHAEQIKFKLFGKKYFFSAPMPKDFQETQKSLQ